MIAPIQTLFAWLDAALAAVPFGAARGITTAFLVLAALAALMLDRETALRGAPGRRWYYDVRLWAAAIMLPYIVIYLVF